ncbi:MAG: BrnA antitoxin family protein [Pseudomonadota bacterium]|nr:BrnA antitoxin family protein [Pseudomonadota bacterium]
MSARNRVKFKLDAKNPPKLTARQRKRLATLATIPDSKIDYSDIPRQTGDVSWTHPGALISSENKRQITLRLDSEILDFFKSTGARYQSRINAVLREYVNAHRNVA